MKRSTKKSKPSSDTSESCNQSCKEAQSSNAAISGSTSPNSKEKKASPVTKSLSDGIGQPNASISHDVGQKHSKKRNWEEDKQEQPRKKSRSTTSPSEGLKETLDLSEQLSQIPADPSDTQNDGAPTPISHDGGRKHSQKRKWEEDEQEQPKKKSRSSSSPSEETSQETEFSEKYEENEVIFKGGFGTVFKGYRKKDMEKVAIKHIPQKVVYRVKNNEGIDGKPIEVELLENLKPEEGKTSAVVQLLDWYDLDDELILVLERPWPCMDLDQYIRQYGRLTEEEAKVITRQLVDAMLEIHSKHVFHRDIKPDNILLDLCYGAPSVRIIDFGLGDFLLKNMSYTLCKGTPQYMSPELLNRKSYMPDSLTVWQIGMVVYEMVHGYEPFQNSKEIRYKKHNINMSLSRKLQLFIDACLEKEAKDRPTLKQLKTHFWLKYSNLD